MIFKPTGHGDGCPNGEKPCERRCYLCGSEKTTEIAVNSLIEENREPQLALEANQKAHQLIQAMGSVVKTDAYLSYNFGKCKLT